MLGRTRAFTRWLTVVFDAVGIVFAVRAAVQLRVLLNPLFHHQFSLETARQFLPPLYLIVPAWLIIFYRCGSYEMTRRTSPVRVFLTVARASAFGLLALVIYWYAFAPGPREVSRSLNVMLSGTSVVVLSFWRLAAFRVLRFLRNRGRAVERFAVVGGAENGRAVISAMEHVTSMTCRFQGFIISGERHDGGQIPRPTTIIDTGGPLAIAQVQAAPDPVLGHVRHLSFVINAYHLDRLIICSTGMSGEELAFCAEVCRRMGVRLNHVPDLHSVGGQKLRLTRVDGVPLIEVEPANLTGWDRLLKRVIDVTVALLLAPILLPVFAIVALAVRLDSRGSVFYTSLRVGRGGKFFPFIKFRSMYGDAEERLKEFGDHNETDGHLFKMRNDPRITRVGRVIRRWSIDELPQFINVLLGHMSLVGPRPLPINTFRLDGESPEFGYWSRQRHSVPPGITGLWQVSGRSDINFRQMKALDLYYIRHWSFWLDIGILLRTIPAVLSRSGAY